MKNLFKNLMLVAVAAMAFTACTEENNDVNAVAKKTVVNGVAIIDADDTRSGFVGSETTENGDGTTTTKYKSAWDGGETIKLFAQGGLETTATIDAEGEGKFSAVFEGELPESFYMTVCSPAEAWSNASSYTIPAEQTPRENSVDPAAHILQKQNVEVTNGTADYVSMEHQVAYGKMTVNTPAEFVIDNVVIELNGVWYDNPRSYSYTINADNVVNNTFWFATDVINVTDFTVTAYDAEGEAYTKSVTIGDKALNFNYGRVSTFSVSNLDVYEKPVGPMFTSAETSSYGDDKYIYFYSADNTLSTLKVNAYGCFSGSSKDIWNEGTYTKIWEGAGMIYTGQYTTYGGIYTNSITVIVSHVEEGYKVVIKNVTDSNNNVLLEEATYVGPISGLAKPDLRTQLETPNVESSISGKTLTLTWEDIENAEGYLVECTSSSDINPISTTETTVTITVPTYDYYSFSVQAVVSEDSETYRSSEKAYIEYSDPREILPAPTNVTATVDGPSVTISWDKVEGADGYQLQYYLNGNQTVDVDDTTVTIDLGYSQSNVWIYVFSVADDTNDKYRSSQSWEASVGVSTGKDPNIFADFMYDTLSWNSQYSRFELTGNGNDMTQFYVNSSDSPNHNSIKARTYTYAGNTVQYPAEGQFSLRYLLGSGAGSAHYVSDASMEVKIENGQYSILITILDAGNSAVKGKTFGYKGLPNDFVLPDGSGDDNTGDGGETPDPEPDQPGDGGDSSDVPVGYNAVEYVSFVPASYYDRTYNWMGDFTFDFQGATIKFTMCDYNGAMQAQNKTVVEGVYTNNGNGANMETMELYNISISGMTGNSGSTVEVSKDGSDYVFKMTFKTVTGDYKFYYKGAL